MFHKVSYAVFKDCMRKVNGFYNHQALLFLRKQSTQSKYTKKWNKHLHIYNYSFNWGGVNELSHLLARDVVLNKDGLVVLNKPFGIGKERPIINKKKVDLERRLNTALVGETDFYLSELLPGLTRKLGCEFLETVKIPERYTSGVTILSASKQLSDHIKQCIQKGKAQNELMNIYRVVCVGTPIPTSFKGKVGIKHEQDKISQGVQPILVRTWSSNAVKRGDILALNVEHNTICDNQFASLVEVVPSRTKSHFIRFYMAYMLSPILGDNLYGSRVQKIGSTSVAISPFSDRAKMPQRLDDNLLRTLDLERRDEVFIPAHIHLQKVIIPNFKGNGQPLVIEAPPPEVFQWTCKRLKLTECAMKEKTEING